MFIALLALRLGPGTTPFPWTPHDTIRQHLTANDGKTASKSTTARHSFPGTPPVVAPAPGPQWHRLYPTLDDPRAREFLACSLAFGEHRFGKPAVQIRTVRLRLSRPLARGLPSGFCLTEINDLETGVLTIYVSAAPGETAFHGQLAHEAFHLFEPRLRDVYIEGLNTFLTQKLFATEGLDWSVWEKHFELGGDPLYGAAFDLMKKLEPVVGERALCGLIRCTSPCPKRAGNPPARKVSVDLWLDSLPIEKRDRARAVILAGHDRIEKLRSATHSDYAFMRPSAPGK